MAQFPLAVVFADYFGVPGEGLRHQTNCCDFENHRSLHFET